MPDANLPRGQIAHNDRSRADDGQFANGHAGSDKDIRSDPRVGANHNRRRDQRHGPIIEVVGASAQMAVLTDVGAVLQANFGEVVHYDVATNHRAGSQRKPPRESDLHAWEDHDPGNVFDAGTENTQKPRSKTVPWPWAPAKQSGLDQSPERSEDDFTPRIRREAILTEVRGSFSRNRRRGGLQNQQDVGWRQRCRREPRWWLAPVGRVACAGQGR